MDYRNLKEGIEYHRSKWPPDVSGYCSYSGLRSRGDAYWRHLEHLGQKELNAEIIEGFLNTKGWNCHIPTRDLG